MYVSGRLKKSLNKRKRGLKKRNNVLQLYFAEKYKHADSGSSVSSRISTQEMTNILEQLKNERNRKTTKSTYLGIWRNFNNFVIKLDVIPNSWERRAILYITYLIDNGAQSATIKSYISAIKSVLRTIDYEWNQPKWEIKALTKSCKMRNDRVFSWDYLRCCFIEWTGNFYKNKCSPI